MKLKKMPDVRYAGDGVWLHPYSDTTVALTKALAAAQKENERLKEANEFQRFKSDFACVIAILACVIAVVVAAV